MIWALHGAVGMPADWKEISAVCTGRGLTVRAVDLMRYLDCCPMSLEEFGRAFCEEVKAVDESPVLLGYSMGARLGLQVLLAEPSLWKGACLVSPHPGLQTEKEKVLRMASDAHWAASALTGEWDDFLQQWAAQPVLSGAEMRGRGDLEIRRQAVARSFMDWSLGKQGDLRERVSEITCPVIWMTGGQDGKFTELASDTVPHFPQAEHRVLAGAGHRLPWESPDSVVEALSELSR